jgi:DNA (cytosine-5)-methyltransferase 1
MRDRPRTIVLEQVPQVLPVWEAYAVALTWADYSVWTGVVEAEAYGVPQTRRRAVLIASRDHNVARPQRTHSRYHTRHPAALDAGMPRWVSMAEAMDGKWEPGVVGFPRRADGRDEGVQIGGADYRSRDLRPIDRPSWGVTGKARSWKRWGFTERPATVVTGHGFATRHPTGTQRVHLNAIAAGTFEMREPWTVSSARLPTYDNVSLSRSYAGDAVNITPAEGAVLQTFAPDFPFVGNRTKVWQTLGNAVPPLLAEHLIRAAL